VFFLDTHVHVLSQSAKQIRLVSFGRWIYPFVANIIRDTTPILPHPPPIHLVYSATLYSCTSCCPCEAWFLRYSVRQVVYDCTLTIAPGISLVLFRGLHVLVLDTKRDLSSEKAR